MTTVIIPELPFPLTPDGNPPCEHRLSGGILTLTALSWAGNSPRGRVATLLTGTKPSNCVPTVSGC